MRPEVFDLDPALIDPDGLADGNSSAGATLTLDGALTSGGAFTSADGLGRRISVLDLGADDQSGATYTFVGTNAAGAAISEDLVGPAASQTVTTTAYFYTVEATPAIDTPAAGSTVDVGTVDEIESRVLPMNYRAHEAATYQCIVTGTVAFSVQETMDDIHNTAATAVNWVTLTSISSATATTKQLGVSHSRACRLIFETFTDGAEIAFTVYQNED